MKKKDIDSAYNLLVLFGAENIQSTIQAFDHFLKSNKTIKVANPLDLLEGENLPKTACLPEWRELIRQFGFKLFLLFPMAEQIENNLGGRTPKNENEAEEAACRVLYKNAMKHMELAKLCLSLKITDEKIFDRCLVLEDLRLKAAKQFDNLPNLIIDGSKIGRQGYYLVKLPPDDVRAYLLGIITACCQSVSGNSSMIERSIVDAMTRPNNGFYVLLKKTGKSKKNNQPIINGKIDYKNFKIIGEGYAWRSEFGNLTIDSWENKRKSADDVIVPMLNEFAKQVVLQSGLDILRITIGIVSKKTPQAFKSSSSNPELMLEGIPLLDANRQHEIYIDDNRKKLLISNLVDHFKYRLNILEINDDKVRELIQADLCNSIGFINGIKSVIDSEEFAKIIGTDLKKLTELIRSIGWQGIIRLHRAHQLLQTNLDIIFEKRDYKNHVESFCYILYKLFQEKLDNTQNIQAVLKLFSVYHSHEKPLGLFAIELMKRDLYDDHIIKNIHYLIQQSHKKNEFRYFCKMGYCSAHYSN